MFFFGFVMLALLVIAAVAAGVLIATSLIGVWTTTGRPPIVVTASLIALVLTFLALVLRRSFRPVGNLIEAAGRLADGDYSARVNVRTSPRTRAVASSFNTMAQRLEQADDQRRRLMSDLSHELRTPLAVIRGEIEAVLDGVRPGNDEQMASLLDEVAVMERLIEDLRILTLSEAGRLRLEPVRAGIVELVEEVAASYRPSAEMAGIDLSTDTPAEEVMVEMDTVRIRQALTNLVVNAVRAMAEGGKLTLRVGVHATRVVVDVVDSGGGIDPERLPDVFERFVKSDDSPGAGLGLSIARGLVRAHGGDLEITESTAKGTTASIWLPR